MAIPQDSAADPGNIRSQRWGDWDSNPRAFDRYLLLKGGGLLIGGEGGPDGAYFGFEVGGSSGGVFDLGIAVDWFHRHRREMQVLFETDHGFEPPVRGEITAFESSTDFVPFGVAGRVRLPLANAAIRPFVAGMAGWEVLYLRYYAHDPQPNPYGALLDRSEWFGGFGWQASAGVEFALGRGVGILGEVGMHRGEPSQSVRLDGVPVDLRVRLNGAFLRAGVRLAI
jgi:hypothetical protein